MKTCNKITFFLSAVILVLSALPSAYAAAGISDADLEAFGRNYAEAINSLDEETFSAFIDARAMAERAAASFTDDPVQQRGYVRGAMRAGENAFAPQLLEGFRQTDGYAVYLRLRQIGDMYGPLVRYDLGDSGYNYVLLLPERDGEGNLKVSDMFIATNGQLFSETTGVISQLMVAPDESLLGKLFGRSKVDKKVLEVFKSIPDLQRAGKPGQALAQFDHLPPAVRNHRAVLNYSILLAVQLDEDIYRRELARLARHHKDDPTAAFLLVDHYFYQQDYESALRGVQNLETTYGEDAAITLMKANLVLEQGEARQALALARHAMELEPNNEDVLWTMVTTLLMNGHYGETVEALERLETIFHYHFEAGDFEEIELYEEFLRSREFKDWMRL